MKDNNGTIDRRTAIKTLSGTTVGIGLAGCLNSLGTGTNSSNSSAASEAASETTLRYAHPNAPSTIVGRFADGLADAVDQKTNGRIAIEVYPSSELGGVDEMIQGASNGSIDMGHNDFAAVAQLYDDLAVFNVPYLYDSIAHAMKATNPATSEVLRNMNENVVQEGNVRILGGAYYGSRHLTTSNTEVNSPSDLNGLQIRAIPLDVWIAMIEGMGANPQSVDFSELSSALATGVVDGQENPLTTIYENSLYENQNYLMLTGHMTSVLGVFINEDTWQSFSDEDRTVLQNTIQNISQQTVEWGREEESETLDSLRSELEIVDEESGLDLGAFETQVSNHMRNEFPNWRNYIQRIEAMSQTISPTSNNSS